MAAIALGLGAVSSFFGQRSADRAKKRAARRQREQRLRELEHLSYYGELSQAKLDAAMTSLGAGFDRARADVGGLESAARQRVMDRETALRGRLQQNLATTGFGRSNVAQRAEQGLAQTTARGQREVDANLAAIYAGLAERRGMSEARLQQAMASTLERLGASKAGAESAYGSRMFDLDTTTFAGPQYDFSGLAELFKDRPSPRREATGGLLGESIF